MLQFAPKIVDDHVSWTLTGKDLAGAPTDITGYTITMKFSDESGNAVTLTNEVDDGITHLAQTGATLGQATAELAFEDFPAAWSALGWGEWLSIRVEVEMIYDGTKRVTQQGKWRLNGQTIA